MNKNIIVAIIGEDDDAGEVLFKGFKEFSPDKVILLVKKNYVLKAKEIMGSLEKFGIESELKEVSENMQMEEVFLEIKKITQLYLEDSVVINVDTDYYTSCLALSSAFVNGIVAIGMLKDEIIVYPIMKFSYYNAINEKKLELLELISREGIVESMEKLSKLSKLSLPLIAYHLRGNRDSKGLIEMNLVKTNRNKGLIELSLTSLGNLIIKGGLACKK